MNSKREEARRWTIRGHGIHEDANRNDLAHFRVASNIATSTKECKDRHHGYTELIRAGWEGTDFLRILSFLVAWNRSFSEVEIQEAGHFYGGWITLLCTSFFSQIAINSK